ncbi:MAG: 23S rRNA (guanosine(2251)-2'-O)-methyltransferase RlmB [Defluviitaleaceae bacterium]|nr:23S rRNA (guanosine(2251)-2'-O)-methyltransferase RlmB [Defluviitaleaceae bacterium]
MKKNFSRDTRDKRREFREEDELLLIGRNAVLEAINHDKTIDKIFIKTGEAEGSVKAIVAKAKERGIVVSGVAKEKLDEMAGGIPHQGVIATRPAKEYVQVEDILNIAKARGEDPFILILDGITDPHNFGAIIRTAEASGVHGIIIPKRRSVSVSGVVSKTSAGAIEHLSVARVTNLPMVIEGLKKAGVWVAAGQMHGKPYYKENLTGAIALVIGGEGEGVSNLIEKKCDYRIKIPMYGKITSLNASVAAGLLMYEVVRQRNFLG